MRPIGLLLCVSACTLDNPAFFVTDTEVGSASGNTSGDPTRPTSTTSAATSATSDPTSTSATTDQATTDQATTANVSDSDVTTDPSAGSTTTTDATTSTTDPQPMTASTTDSSGIDTDPVPCGFIDFIGPQLPLQVLPGNVQPSTGECMGWAGKEYAGKLEVIPGSVKIHEDEDCPSINLPDDGFAFPMSLAATPVGDDQCVKLRFSVHPDADKCTVSAFAVTQGAPVLVGSFGRSMFGPEVPFQLGFHPTGVCGACNGCCGPAPDPDVYTFEVPNHSVPEGQKLELDVNGKAHLFHNLRSHIHGPDCQNEELTVSEWQHFDWVTIRLE
ncbi:hypothetical protein SAMN02745121_08118 [Nannocystis exedens]|uniref:Uncharacterized protein n=1 Tax=Nannocystis exedens TaxID=54 RepID=A0A1I2HRF6_9BACT|nr:hypothetical protein [Nannocystis exedens]PCC69427.1 hypothetical protein NAEX_02449 [Nannocystis exedens]SFF31963.1 hypothetical protein SAMN02745121_08118 [Nannocystis exedens]